MGTTYDEVIEAQGELERVTDAYLRGSGWKYVCDMPGAQWLWRKTVREQVITVDESSAIYMQRNLDEI